MNPEDRNCLAHHGILGMKWGVRRYQNRDGTLTAAGKKRAEQYTNNGTNYSGDDYTLKKGTKFQRIGTADETDTHQRTYVTYDKDDNRYYVGLAGEAINGNKKISLTSKEDLHIANGKSLVNAYTQLLSSLPASVLSEPEKGTPLTKENKKEIKELQKIYKNALTDQESFDKSYNTFQAQLMKDTTASRQYFNILREKGYNAMIDYNDNKGLMQNVFSKSPLIVFDRGNSLKTTSIKEITTKEKDDAQAWYEKKWNNSSYSKITKMMLDNETKQDEIASFVNKFLVSLV